MVRITFENAVVTDKGYGLYVNGESITDIISTALKTRVGDKTPAFDSDIPEFKSNSCHVEIYISPNDNTTFIETDECDFHSIEELEDFNNEWYRKKINQTD